MMLKWRFTGGILFSITLHVFLLSAMIYWYPGIISKNDWEWDEWSPFFANQTASSGVSGLTTQEYGRKVSSGILIFPDVVLSEQPKNAPVINIIKKKTPQISLRSILTQVGKFPERLKKSAVSSKPLSDKKLMAILSFLFFRIFSA